MYGFVENSSINGFDILGNQVINSMTANPQNAALAAEAEAIMGGFASAADMAATNAALNAALAARAAQLVKEFTSRAKGNDPCEEAKNALKQAQDSLKSTSKTLQEHQQAAANPESQISDPAKLANPRYVEGLGNWYQKEVVNQENQIKALDDAIKTLQKAADKACKCWYKPWTWFD